jgi:hypothetical protein
MPSYRLEKSGLFAKLIAQVNDGRKAHGSNPKERKT